LFFLLFQEDLEKKAEVSTLIAAGLTNFSFWHGAAPPPPPSPAVTGGQALPAVAQAQEIRRQGGPTGRRPRRLARHPSPPRH